MRESRIEMAAAYAAAGYQVFPVHSVEQGQCSCGKPDCNRKGKHPRTRNGLNDATNDSSQVNSWWETSPNSNIGIRTGRESGCFVVDIDGDLGREWLAGFDLPPTPTANTGGGGLHVFFRYPDGLEIKNSASKIAPEVDIRGDGGYIIVAPSVHASGRTYEWVSSLLDTELADAPPELINKIMQAKTKHTESKPLRRVAPAGSPQRQYTGADQGNRDDSLFRFACSLETAGLNPEEFRTKVLEANLLNSPPLEQHEVERIITSARRYFSRADLVDRLIGLSSRELSNEVFRPEMLASLAESYRYDTAAWARLKPALSKAHIVRELTNAIKQKIKAESVPAPDAESTVGALDKAGVPCPEGLGPDSILPVGYMLSRSGLFRSSGDDVIEVSPAIVIPNKRIKNHATREESLRLLYFEQSRWRSLLVRRSDALDNRKIVALADYGFPVSSVNAKEVVRFHHAYLALNQDHMETESVADQLGWVDDSAFLLREVISAEPMQLQFSSNDAGESQVLDSIGSEGTFEEWCGSINLIKHYPKAMVAVYASFAAPLLRILKAPNILVDFSGLTSTGKTTVQRAAASVWGNPDERSGSSFIRNWDTTRVGLERTLAALNDLPCIIDDTKKADPKQLERLVYLIVNGQGRMRGSKAGLARNANWRTVAISSGEAPLTCYSVSSGAFARIIPIKGAPFGTTDDHTRQLVDQLNRAVRLHYGHAGARFVAWIVENMTSRAEWQSRYDELRNRFPELSGATARIADACAVISLAGELVHEALQLPWTYEDPVESLWPSIADEFAEIDVGTRALRDVYEWACSNQNGFFGKEGGYPPAAGWLGQWDHDGPNWASLNIVPGVLKQQIERLGYTYREILNNWKEKGWLQLDVKGDNPRHRLAQQRIRMISISRGAISQVTGEELPLLNEGSPLRLVAGTKLGQAGQGVCPGVLPDHYTNKSSWDSGTKIFQHIRS